jgi:hypothetical protein
MKINLLIEKIIKELVSESPEIVRYDKIKNNIKGVLKLFGGEIIKVKFNDGSTIVFDIKNNKLLQSSEGRSIKNFAVEVKRYIRNRHDGNIIPFIEEFNNFEGYSKLEENKKNMKTKKINLTEFRKLVIDIIKEEKELNENLDVKKNKVINKLKLSGLKHDDAKKLADSNEDIISSDKDVNKIAVELKNKHKGS